MERMIIKSRARDLFDDDLQSDVNGLMMNTIDPSYLTNNDFLFHKCLYNINQY